MYDDAQQIRADYLLSRSGLPLGVMEAKAEGEDAYDGIQQAERYARRLGLRFALASNGRATVMVDLETGERVDTDEPPTPAEVLARTGRTVDWETWAPTFEQPYWVDQVTQRTPRAYQRMAIGETLIRFASGERRVFLLMATGTGKTYTVFQLVWKLIRGGSLRHNRVLFLTDRTSLRAQAHTAFAAFPQSERVLVDVETVRQRRHEVGNVYFANYQTLCEELDGRPVYEHFDADFFDLVVVDECHRSGFGDWFGVLEHFGEAYQLGLTATPREIEAPRALTDEEARRDTYTYFTGSSDGEPAFTYSLRQAIEDGYLVPYLLEERVTNLDDEGFTTDDGDAYQTHNFERQVRLPSRTRLIAEDLWEQLTRHDLQHEKTVVFCVDDTHAAMMAQELRRLSGDPDYAARITRSERNSHQLERNFKRIGPSKPRVAVTVDLLTTGFDAPDVKNIVFARPVRSPILYKQMKGRGTRLCEDIDKRYFTIWDYVGASDLEEAEFDGHPVNTQGPVKRRTPRTGPAEPEDTLVIPGVNVFIARSERSVCLADGRKIPLDEYRAQMQELVRELSGDDLQRLYGLWVGKESRAEFRAALAEHDAHPAAFRHYYELEDADDVDVIAKVGWDLVRVPMRRDRVARMWSEEGDWLASLANGPEAGFKLDFWETALDHYAMFGIDDLENGKTYGAPQFASRFGPFRTILDRYGDAATLRGDLERVKEHLYVPLFTS